MLLVAIASIGTLGFGKIHGSPVSGLGFVQNRGQWLRAVAFHSDGNGSDLWISRDHSYLDLHVDVPVSNPGPMTQPGRERIQAIRHGQVLSLRFKNSRPSLPLGIGRLKGELNYLLGDDRSHWGQHVPRFSQVLQKSIYPGIDAKWSLDSSSPRFDFIANPGSDPSKVELDVSGGSTRVKNGSIVVETRFGAISIGSLAAYQTVGTLRRPVTVAFRQKRDGQIGFRLGSYDKRRPLVIDPTFEATFLGAPSGITAIQQSVFDASGNIYSVGGTTVSVVPTSVGAYDTSTPVGTAAYITELTPDMATLVFGTLFGTAVPFYNSGDSRACQANGIALDSKTQPVICGTVFGPGLPVTAGASVTTYNPQGDAVKGFVSRFLPDGSDLVSSTYMGSQYTVDPIDSGVVLYHDDALVSGYTRTYASIAAFPTVNGFDSVPPSSGTAAKGYIARVNPGGQIVGSSLFGGQDDLLYGITVALASANGLSQDVIWVCGSEHSGAGGMDGGENGHMVNGNPQPNGGVAILVGGMTPDLSRFLVGGYFGGSSGGAQNGYHIAYDSIHANLVISGVTFGGDLPTTLGAFMPSSSYNPGEPEAFVCSLNSVAGLKPVASTYLGGAPTNLDGGNAASNPPCTIVDPFGCPVVAVEGSSDGATVYQTSIIRLAPDLSGATTLVLTDSSTSSNILSLAADPFGSLLVSGWVGMGLLQGTSGTLQPTYPGGTLAGFIDFLSLSNVSKLYVSPILVPGGATATGTLELSAPAPAGGVDAVVLSNSSVAQPPIGVSIPQGQLSATFSIPTSPVGIKTQVTLSAIYAGVTIKKGFQVDSSHLLSASVSPAAVTGGNSVNLTLQLSSEAPAGGIPVSLTVSNAAAVLSTTTATVPAGATTVTVPISTLAVAGATNITVTATTVEPLPPHSRVKTATFQIIPPILSAMHASPFVVRGGSTTPVTLTAFLSGIAPNAGAIVSLRSSNAAVSVPATLTIPAGSQSMSVTLTTKAVKADTIVLLTGTYAPAGGTRSSWTASLLVTP